MDRAIFDGSYRGDEGLGGDLAAEDPGAAVVRAVAAEEVTVEGLDVEPFSPAG